MICLWMFATCVSAQRPEGVSCEPLDVGVRNQTWKQVPLTTDISAAHPILQCLWRFSFYRPGNPASRLRVGVEWAGSNGTKSRLNLYHTLSHNSRSNVVMSTQIHDVHLMKVIRNVTYLAHPVSFWNSVQFLFCWNLSYIPADGRIWLV